MRAVIQRVSAARVTVAGAIVGDIGPGLLVFLGVAPTDTEADVQWLAEKISKLRIFPDAEGHMNRSLLDAAPPPRAADLSSGLSALDVPLSAPSALVVSQLTLLASTRKGTRPSFKAAVREFLLHLGPGDRATAEHLWTVFQKKISPGERIEFQGLGLIVL